jgi:hypothetical protein
MATHIAFDRARALPAGAVARAGIYVVMHRDPTRSGTRSGSTVNDSSPLHGLQRSKFEP